MDIDFPLILVIATFVTGMVALIDILVFKPKRIAAGSESQGEEALTEHWLVETSKSFFPVLAIVLVLRSFLAEPFQIPSGSMLPTLEVGDFILVNKFEYGLRLPVAGTKILEINDPQPGDIMVFKFPGTPKVNYIKRVVGVPGDTVRYQDKQLYLNGELVDEKHLAKLREFNLFEENLAGVEHQIYENRGRNPGLPSGLGEGEWTVPDNQYFVMGDNRDNSNDSRFWGFVPDELVVGKAFAIWMQWESFTSLPSFSRVGTIQ